MGSVSAEGLIRRVPVAAVVGDEFSAVVAGELDAAVARLDPAAGVVLQVVWFDPDPDPDPDAGAGAGVGGRLLVVAHHVVVDGVSWRILVPDLAAAWARIEAGGEPEVAAAGTSMRRWAYGLVEAAHAVERVGELDLWRGMLGGADPVMGSRPLDPAVDVGATVGMVGGCAGRG